jgi:hypothetical protein
MKRILIVALCGIACAGPAFGQGGSIMCFSSSSANSINFRDFGDQSVVRVYIFHMYLYDRGATRSEWRLEVPSDWELIGDTKYFNDVVGTSVEGCVVSYGGCVTGDLILIRASFFGSPDPAGTPTCTLIRVGAAPGNAGVRMVDCAENNIRIPGGEGVVNGDGTCEPGPVASTTWGQIKTLYQ